MKDSLAVLVTCALIVIMAGIEFGMAGARGRSRRSLEVLVIERDDRLRGDLCAFVRRRGHAPTAAATVDTAIRLGRRSPPDLVLVDQAAISAARYLRAAGNRATIVVMASANDPGLAVNLRGHSVDEVLLKPLRIPRLSAVLDRASDTRSSDLR